MFLILLGFLLNQIQPASAMSPCQRLPDEASLRSLVGGLIQESFPKLELALQEGRIQFCEFENSNEYFLKTRVLNSFLTKPNQRIYAIDIHRKMSVPGFGPSELALKGILAHELMHLEDYETGRFLSEVIKSKYERSTDLNAFKRGYALGIKEYRAWIYSKLNNKAVQIKRRKYYTPEEIDDWLAH